MQPLYNKSCADAQEDDCAFLEEMLSGLTLNCASVIISEPTRLDPLWAAYLDRQRVANAKKATAHRRYAEIRARYATPDGPPVPANDDAPAPTRPLARIPKSRVIRPRTSYARDRRNLHKIPGFMADVRSMMPEDVRAPSVAGPLPSLRPSETASTLSKKPISKTTKMRQKAAENDTRAAPTWDRTTEIIKGACYVRTVSTTGAGMSWTLNIGRKVMAAANDNPKAFKPWMHDRIVKGLKASPLGAREFVSAIEITRTTSRIHLHGVIDATENERDEVEMVLAKAGGAWGSAHHREKQTHTGVLWGVDGWGRYMLKDLTATKTALGIKTVFSVTRGCRARAEALWEASRKCL